MIGRVGAVASPARAGATPAAGVWRSAAVAVSALAAGAGLVGIGLAWAPRGDAQAVARGARIYAAECAACHGARLEGATAPPGAPGPLPPPLGATGHAWRHPDARLAATVAHGTRSDPAGGTPGTVPDGAPGAASGGAPGAAPSGAPGMPAFADRLGPDGIADVLAYVKSHWPAGLRARQAALDPDGADALATLARDPAWTFPGRCLPAPAANGES